MLGSDWLRESLQDCRAVYAAGAEAAGMAAWAMRGTKVPVLYDVHTPAVGERWMALRMHPSARELAVYIESAIAEYMSIREADHILWCSSIQQQYYGGRGFPKERMTEVRHGVDLDRFAAGPVPRHEIPLLVYAGTMRAYQGAELLLEAFEKTSGLRMRMVGFTPDEGAMRERADTLGIETHPMVPHDKLPDYLKDATATVIVAHPDAVRHKNGAAPTKWPECLALGRPILSVDAYDTRDLIEQLDVGWVVPNTAQGLADGMSRLATSSFEHLSAMGDKARAEAEKHYGWKTIGEKFVAAILSSTKR
jgi:glycosyltransferase involved in cell wall biosynthesis